MEVATNGETCWCGKFAEIIVDDIEGEENPLCPEHRNNKVLCIKCKKLFSLEEEIFAHEGMTSFKCQSCCNK